MAETGAEEVYQSMAQRNAVLIPTLAQAEANYALMIDPYALEKLRGRVWEVILDSIANPQSVTRARLNNRAYVADVRRSLEISMNNLRRAVRAGVKIAMGTNSGNAGAIHGALVSRELELMVASGMTPMEAIVAATRNAAEVIGKGETLGTLEAGKLADLVVIDSNPLRDIGAMHEVSLVVRGGQVIDPATLTYQP